MNILIGVFLVILAAALLPAWVILVPGIIVCLMAWSAWKMLFGSGFSSRNQPQEPEPEITILERSELAARQAVERARQQLGH